MQNPTQFSRVHFQSQVYGQFPDYDPAQTRVEVTESRTLLSGHDMQNWTITVPLPGGDFSFRAERYVPANATAPAPAFLFVNRDDWTLAHVKAADIDGYYPLQAILDRGFAVVNVDVQQAAEDSDAGFRSETAGMRPLLGQNPDAADRLGALGIWAFTAMRVMDAIQRDPRIQADQVGVIGLSRLGKTALLSGAFDPRFALTVSVNSGCGGAALAKDSRGEQIADITKSFPHWFAPNYATYADDPSHLAFDQDALLALVAPRLLYVTSSEDDAWADPASEFRCAKFASAVYSSEYGLDALTVDESAVQTGTPYHEGSVAYHRRSGGHGLKRIDWDWVMDFAEKKLFIEKR